MRDGRVVFLDPLPLRVRAKLKVAHMIDGVAVWLVKRDHTDAAVALWRFFGLWTDHE